jgi:hypothetical protein
VEHPAKGDDLQRISSYVANSSVFYRCQRLTSQEGAMALSKEERVRELARLVGIPIMEQELAEVADRFESLIGELDRLLQVDLADVQPVTMFPEEG